MLIEQIEVFDKCVRISCDDAQAGAVIAALYSGLRIRNFVSAPALEISVHRDRRMRSWRIDLPGRAVTCTDLDDLAYCIEKEMTIALQALRPDLYFVHAAALALHGRGMLFAGESGIGKSSICWGLCNEGFSYLSDELAPIDPRRGTVIPYPHAICLKATPVDSYAVPSKALRLHETMHIPVSSIPCEIANSPVKLTCMLFIVGESVNGGARLEKIDASEAAARLYANGLNQLAHDHCGLRVANSIASQVACYKMKRCQPRLMREMSADLVAA